MACGRGAQRRPGDRPVAGRTARAAHLAGGAVQRRRSAGHQPPVPIDQALPGEVRLRFTPVERPMYEAAYGVIANPLLWFLQHQMGAAQPADDRHRHAARLGQRLRARQRGISRAALAEAGDDPEPRVMVHDYHLYLAPSFIRQRRPGAVVSHFTHIPWPPSSLWQVITPRIRTAIVEGCRRPTWWASRRSATPTTSCAPLSRSCPARGSTIARAACCGRTGT